MNGALTIQPASNKDTEALVSLVNSAYRGETSKKGWTTEADLLDGQRTDPASMQQLLEKEGSVVLKCINENGELLGCVNLQQQTGKLYLGMLTVEPGLQGGGIGKRLLAAAEVYARSSSINKIRMTVISVRTELIEWYERHGYHRTGETAPFPAGDPRFGLPRQELEFIVLEKAV